MSTNSDENNVDLREQTFNQGYTGLIERVSTGVELVGQILMIMFDLDLKLFNPDGPFSAEELTPQEFYEEYVARWLDNHSVLKKAEVRFTGGGFHVLLRLETPIRTTSKDQRKRWKGIVQVAQMALPIDPKQPGINAMTRPVGSVNGKNGETVTCLREGEPVTEQEILSLFEEMRRRPFPTLMKIWFGSEKVTPCPICESENSYLEADGTKRGRCYGPCRAVSINNLFDAVLKTASATSKGGKR